MIGFLKTNKISSVVLALLGSLVFLSLLSWAPSMPSVYTFGWLGSVLAQLPFWLQKTFGLTLSLWAVWYTSFITSKHQLFKQDGQLVTVLATCFLLLNSQLEVASIVTFSSIALVRFFDRCFEIQNSTKTTPIVFDASFLIGVLAAFYLPYLLLLVLLWLAILTSGKASFRSFILSIFTIAIVAYIILGLFYLFDVGVVNIHGLNLSPSLSFEFDELIVLGVIAVAFLAALPSYFGALQVNKTLVKNHYLFLAWSGLVLVICISFSNLNWVQKLSVLFFPLAVILNNAFIRIRKRWLANLLFNLLLIVVLAYTIKSVFAPNLI